MITLKNVSKFYYNKGIIASGFTKINLTLNIGEFVAITGESGSGKSTLLNVISGLDSYEEGEMYIDGKETSHYTEIDFENYRKKYISNIFQNFNLVNSYTVKQNIELVLLFNGYHGKEVKNKVNDLIKKVGLQKYRNTKVSKLSGGQKQRVAIARALAKETPIIIADEPTGNLDTKSAKSVLELLHNIAKDKLVIIVTHNYEQIEPFVTRKIKMHDGKLLEDKVITKTEKINFSDNNQKLKLNIIDKFKLGIRNAFNIIPKFLLTLAVYLFITIAVTTEYSFFKKQEYDTNFSGFNNFFRDTRDTRIIIKKKDKSSFTEDDYNKISNISNVKQLIKNDLLLDSDVFATDNNNFFFYGIARDINKYKVKPNIGRLPEKDNELLLSGSKDNYYLNNIKDKIINSKVSIGIMGESNDEKNYTIVGISYTKEESSNLYTEGYIYGTSTMIENIQYAINRNYSTLKVFFNNKYHDSELYMPEYRIIPSNKVPSGESYVTEDWNYECGNNNCLWEKMSIEVKNMYYEDKIDIKVTKLYNKKNIESLVAIKDFAQYNGAIFINNNDYSKLFTHGNYQSSIYVNDVKNVDTVAKQLSESNYETLKIKDVIYNGELAEVLIIIRTIVTAVLLITLFFISYFVIRIILKSRNNYFGTIRILGATKKDAKHLLEIELLTVSNMAYLLFLVLLYLHKIKILNVKFAPTIIKYLTLKEYIILYIVISLMSYLISLRYSRKLFKNSAMSIMREEA